MPLFVPRSGESWAFSVDAAPETFAEGHYVRRYATLPFSAGAPGAASR